MLYEKAESIDYRYDMHDETVEGLLILPLYGSMPTGRNTMATSFLHTIFSSRQVITLKVHRVLRARESDVQDHRCFLNM